MENEISANKTSGIFKYHSDGFSVQLKEGKKKIKWVEIERLEGYKQDLFTTDEICLNIVLKNSFVTISEETNGWEDFLKRILVQFPSLEKDWDSKITQAPFATNFTVLFSK